MATSIGSLYAISASGLRAIQTEMEVIANNVANINTIGYKRSRLTFQTYLSAEETVEPEQGTPQGVEIGATQRLFEQGIIQPTGNPWDIAIHGDGFFTVALVEGGLAYTRDGTFRPDANGQLTTIQGHRLMPPITVPEDVREVYIASNGEVVVERGEGPEVLGTIQLAYFTNPEGLESIGSNLYIATPASGAAQIGLPGEGNRGKLVSQALEHANVDSGQEMVGLMMAQRAYGLSLRALMTSDQMVARMTGGQ